MTQVILRRAPANSDVYCYDDETNAGEVNNTLHEIVREFQSKKNIWVISGTHGRSDAIVDPSDTESVFKYEDLDSARVTSKNINIMDYHLLAPNRWHELRGKPGGTNVIVLAWCWSWQWFSNNIHPQGNYDKL